MNNRFDISKFVKGRRYLLKFLEPGVDYGERYGGSDNDSNSSIDYNEYKRNSGSEEESEEEEEESEEEEEESVSESESEVDLKDTIVTLECEFIHYFDKSLFQSFKEYNILLNEGNNETELLKQFDDLKTIYETDIDDDYEYTELKTLDFENKLYPYQRIIFKNIANDLEYSYNFEFSTNRDVPSDLLIGLFKVIKIRNGPNDIMQDNPSIENICLAEYENDVIEPDTFIWVQLNAVYEIKTLVEDDHKAKIIGNLNIPDEIIDTEILSRIGIDYKKEYHKNKNVGLGVKHRTKKYKYKKTNRRRKTNRQKTNRRKTNRRKTNRRRKINRRKTKSKK
jgi:hypothetical protein